MIGRCSTLTLAGLMLAGCTGGLPAPPPSGVRDEPSAMALLPGAEAPTTTQPMVTLVADLSEAPTLWTEVASIPFGPGQDQLGLVEDRRIVSLSAVPRSFAIDRDSSIWVLDWAKQRLAHFSESGRYLDQIGPLALEDRTTLRDIAAGPEGLFVMLESHPGPTLRHVESRLATANGQPPTRWITPHEGRRRVYLSQIFPPIVGGDGDLVGTVHAYEDITFGYPSEYAAFDMTGTGEARYLPGLPIGPNAWASAKGTSDERFEVTFTTEEGRWVQPVLVNVVTSAADDASRLPAVVGASIEASTPGGVGFLVEVSPTRPDDAERYGGGRWYLQVGPDGEPLVWEPIPYGYHQQEQQVRHLASGPDGAVYLMVRTRNGERILRRP